MYYPVAAAGTYFIGRNILFRGTSYAIDYLLNSNADPDIKETHTVETIKSMLNAYSDLEDSHPAYESKRSVEEALRELQDVVDRARLKLSVHEAGWVTRWRTFDARSDNTVIEKKARELMSRLDIFTKLIQLREVPKKQENQDSDDNKNNTKDADGIADHEDVMPVTTVALSLYRDPLSFRSNADGD